MPLPDFLLHHDSSPGTGPFQPEQVFDFGSLSAVSGKGGFCDRKNGWIAPGSPNLVAAFESKDIVKKLLHSTRPLLHRYPLFGRSILRSLGAPKTQV